MSGDNTSTGAAPSAEGDAGALNPPSTADGNARPGDSSSRAGQAPSSPANELTLDAIQQVIGQAVAPLTERIDRIETGKHARRRISHRGDAGNSTDNSTDDGDGESLDIDGVDLSKLPKPVREHLERQNRQMKALLAAEETRKSREQADRKSAVLDELIGAEGEKFVNTQWMRRAIEPHVTEGQDGTFFFDDGKTTLKLEDAIRQTGAESLFQKPSQGGGAGTRPTEGGVTVTRDGKTRAVTDADVEGMSDDDVLKLAANLGRG